MNNNRKKQVRDFILEDMDRSGLNQSQYAKKRLGLNPTWINHLRDSWDKPGVIGDPTWSTLESYMTRRTKYVGIVTANYKEVVIACDRALESKQTFMVIGEGGYGKTFSLLHHREEMEREGKKVYYIDMAEHSTRKRLIVAIMKETGCHKEGVIQAQVMMLKEHLKRQNALLILDEASSLRGEKVTFLKTVMTALKDVAGIVLSGTPYLKLNLEKGAERDRFLYSETRDRIFTFPTELKAPTDDEAEAIFKANGLEGNWLEIVMGKNKKLLKFYWRNKPTFRGIADAIEMVRIASMPQREVELFKTLT